MAVEFSEQEFLADRARYFSDKPALYVAIKKDIAKTASVRLQSIRICGSAYWGKSFPSEKDFRPGLSDLDVAIIDETLFVQCLTEARNVTRGFNERTAFQNKVNSYEIFRDYVFKKGIIRFDLMPRSDIKSRFELISRSISKRYLEHFDKITFAIYDTDIAFIRKQSQAAEKFRGGKYA